MHEEVVVAERPEEDVRQDVMAAMLDLEQVRSTRPPVQVQVHDGEVTVSGVVRSRVIAQRLVWRLTRVPGVKWVHSELTDDVTIELAIAHALAADERVKSFAPRIWVNSYHGAVDLEGRVGDEAVCLAAGELAAGVPGVRYLANDLT